MVQVSFNRRKLFSVAVLSFIALGVVLAVSACATLQNGARPSVAKIAGLAPEITLINVHLPVPSPRARAWLGKDVIDKYYSEEADEALAGALVHLQSSGRTANTLRCVGAPGHEIAMAAGKEFQLIVMGTHGRTALGNLVMGSVAMRTVAEATVPVLLVK